MFSVLSMSRTVVGAPARPMTGVGWLKKKEEAKSFVTQFFFEWNFGISLPLKMVSLLTERKLKSMKRKL